MRRPCLTLLLAACLVPSGSALAGVLERESHVVMPELAYVFSSGRDRRHALRIGASQVWKIGDKCTYWGSPGCTTYLDNPAMVFPLLGLSTALEWRGGRDIDVLLGPRGGVASLHDADFQFMVNWSAEGTLEVGVALKELEPRMRFGLRGLSAVPPCFGPLLDPGPSSGTICQGGLPVLGLVGVEVLQPGGRQGVQLAIGVESVAGGAGWLQ